jgi:hypothetical protein
MRRDKLDKHIFRKTESKMFLREGLDRGVRVETAGELSVWAHALCRDFLSSSHGLRHAMAELALAFP